MRIILKIFVLSIFIAPLMLITPLVAAHGGEDHGTKVEERAHEAKDRVSAKLDETKKRVCENRSKNINAIMTRSVSRAQNQMTLFANITDRVVTFYEKKDKTVANYDQLVAAVDAAEVRVDENIETMREKTLFSCDSEDPKGEIDAFKDAHQQVALSLKEYRVAVKNLIAGVRIAQEQGDAQ